MLCWIPYFAVHNVRIHSHYCIKVPRAVIVFAETVALLNSAMNPIFYGLFNVHIRRGLRDIMSRASSSSRSRSFYGRDSTVRRRGTATAHVVALTTSTCAPDASSMASPALSNGRWMLQQQQQQQQHSLQSSTIEVVPLVAINGDVTAASEV
ncbi:hypothetical protein V5799_016122 [Amblyomma americanum]|uniref:G-protein coupled receptors family 1 profile domain-containing protein n=1 Tax=Amblyomma americanum TaxID=6943 RepID=A0AAQ4F5Y3_AMBAM